MKKSTLLGSVVSVLLAFSVISHARTYVQPQDPKPVQQTKPDGKYTEHNARQKQPGLRRLTTLVEPVNADSKTLRLKCWPGTVTVPGEIYSATAV